MASGKNLSYLVVEVMYVMRLLVSEALLVSYPHAGSTIQSCTSRQCLNTVEQFQARHCLICFSRVLWLQVVDHLGLSESLVAQIESVTIADVLSGQKRTHAQANAELPDGAGAGNALEVCKQSPCLLLGTT